MAHPQTKQLPEVNKNTKFVGYCILYVIYNISECATSGNNRFQNKGGHWKLQGEGGIKANIFRVDFKTMYMKTRTSSGVGEGVSNQKHLL